MSVPAILTVYVVATKWIDRLQLSVLRLLAEESKEQDDGAADVGEKEEVVDPLRG